jgi:16S rRNA (cytosine1402-N4)-methyltransferase
MSAPHIPVLLNEVVAALAPRAGGIYVDGTFGAGGYSAVYHARTRAGIWAWGCSSPRRC